MNRLQFTAAFEELTARRKQVLKLLLAGAGDRDIAQQLHITESTVRKHIENICLAFGLKQEFPDDRRSKRPDLIALFAKYQPDMVTLKSPKDVFPDAVFREREDINRDDLEACSLYNRDVFILIDSSGSMVRKDADTGNQTRYEYLAEVVEGQIAAILSRVEGNCGKICDRVFVYFFSQARGEPHPIIIRDASQVWKLFEENKPKTKTFIGPTLEHCITSWLTRRKSSDRGAFFIIYTDGQFDDEDRFVNCIASVCTQIKNHRDVKFFVLGLGKDIDIEHFLALDFNVNKIMRFNVLVFDLVNEVDDIIELLSRQLTDDPHLAFPDWVRVRHPELVEKVLEKIDSPHSVPN